MDVDGKMPSIVGKGDTSARVLKDGKPGHLKSLPGKDNVPIAKSDKMVGEVHISDTDTTFLAEGVNTFEAIFE